MAHAILSPSSAARWMACPGAPAMERDLPDTGSDYASEGTAAHFLAEECIKNECDTAAFADCRILVCADGDVSWLEEGWGPGKNALAFDVAGDMAEQVQKTLDYVRGVAGESPLLSEQKLSIEFLTGEEGASGTSDFVILLPDELVIADLKYGRGVKVDADGNPQLAIYARAAVEEFSLVHDFSRVRMAIHQPRLDHVSEAVMTLEELERFAESVRRAAFHATQVLNHEQHGAIVHHLAPGEKQCQFCKAKATCPKLASHVLSTVAQDFEDMAPAAQPAMLQPADTDTLGLDALGAILGQADVIEGWIKAIRSRAESEMLQGNPVPGWKLVEGRRGARKWSDPAEVEAAMKAMRLKQEQMYDFTLISPTTAEKLAKDGSIGPRQWPKLQDLITQSDGKPSVAPETDKRPALVIATAAEDFAELDDAGDLV
jgi:hypothetical protein